jgi:hypothetical protein
VHNARTGRLMAPGRFRPWTTSTRGLNAHRAPESGIPCRRAAFPSVPLHAVPLIHTFGPTAYSVNGTCTWSYPFEIALPVRQPKGHGFTRARVCSGDMIRLELAKAQRSSRQVNTPSEEQWNCRGPQFLTPPLSNTARPYNVVPPAPALTVPAPQGAT